MGTMPSPAIFPIMVQHSSDLPVVQTKNITEICISYYCCITNYWSLTELKQDPYVSSQFCRLAIWAWYIWMLSSESHKAKIKLHSFPGLGVFSSTHSGDWQNFMTYSYRTEVPIFLLDICCSLLTLGFQGLFSDPNRVPFTQYGSLLLGASCLIFSSLLRWTFI